MRRERRPTGALIFLAVLIVMLVFISRAQAHTSAELDAWKVGWVERADISLSDALFYEWDDMQNRHPWFWNPPAETTTTPRAIANPRGVGAGVEQWRNLVAAYFPADQIDRALCIIGRESNGDPNAYNSSSGASGRANVGDGSHPQRRDGRTSFGGRPPQRRWALPIPPRPTGREN